MASPGAKPWLISMAIVTPVSARIEPTERSMPPVRMTNVIPMATTPMMED